MVKTRKRTTKWSGWKKQQPSRKQRSKMLQKCGKKCFLGAKKSFPICNKNTCKINKKGVWSAYIRARQMGSKKSKKNKYNIIANKAERMLRNI